MANELVIDPVWADESSFLVDGEKKRKQQQQPPSLPPELPEAPTLEGQVEGYFDKRAILPTIPELKRPDLKGFDPKADPFDKGGFAPVGAREFKVGYRVPGYSSGQGKDEEPGQGAESRPPTAQDMRAMYKRTGGKGMPSAGAMSYLPPSLRPLAAGKYFPENWESKMQDALDKGAINQKTYDKAIGQYQNWLNTGLGAGVDAQRKAGQAELDIAGEQAELDKAAVADRDKIIEEGLRATALLETDSEQFARFETEAKATLENHMADMAEARRRLRDMKMNVMGNAVGQVVGGIGMALGAAAATMTGTRNFAADIVQQGIDARTRQLELEYKKNMGDAQASANAFGQAVRATKDERQARLLLRSQLMENTSAYIAQQQELATNADAKRRLESVKSELDKRAEVMNAEIKANALAAVEGAKQRGMRGAASKLSMKRQKAQAMMDGKILGTGRPKGYDHLRANMGRGVVGQYWVPEHLHKDYNKKFTALNTMKDSMRQVRNLVTQAGVGDLTGPEALSGGIQTRLNGLIARIGILEKEAADTGQATSAGEMENFLVIRQQLQQLRNWNPFDTGTLDPEALLNSIEANIDSSLAQTHSSLQAVARPGEITYVRDEDGNLAEGYTFQIEPGARKRSDAAKITAEGTAQGGSPTGANR